MSTPKNKGSGIKTKSEACKYGKECFNKNKEHAKKYSHPSSMVVPVITKKMNTL